MFKSMFQKQLGLIAGFFLIANFAMASWDPRVELKVAEVPAPVMESENEALIRSSSEMLQRQGQILKKIESTSSPTAGLQLAFNEWTNIREILGIDPQIVSQESFFIPDVSLGEFFGKTFNDMPLPMREKIARALKEKRAGHFIDALNFLRRVTALYAKRAADIIKEHNAISEFTNDGIAEVIAAGVSLPIYIRDLNGKMFVVFSDEITRGGGTEAFWYTTEVQETQEAVAEIFGSDHNFSTDLKDLIEEFKIQIREKSYNIVLPRPPRRAKKELQTPVVQAPSNDEKLRMCQRSIATVLKLGGGYYNQSDWYYVDSLDLHRDSPGTFCTKFVLGNYNMFALQALENCVIKNDSVLPDYDLLNYCVQKRRN